MNYFILYPFWINDVAFWSDFKSLNGPVGTENREVAIFTHRDTTQLIESTFDISSEFKKLNEMSSSETKDNLSLRKVIFLSRINLYIASNIKANIGVFCSCDLLYHAYMYVCMLYKEEVPLFYIT